MREAQELTWEHRGLAQAHDPACARGPRGAGEPRPASVDLPSFATLRIIEALSRHRRVAPAAAELKLSHAAVSQALSRLESKYGHSFFLRTSFGVEATPACEALVEAYLAASAGLRRALTDGERRHAFIPLTAWRWLSPTVSRLCARLPDLSVHAYQDGAAVDLAGVDFAILPQDQLPAAGFQSTPLYDERLLPVCSPGFAAQSRIETPARLARARLLIDRPELWRRWFARAGLIQTPELAGPTIVEPALALEAALQGQGVALCCSLAAAPAMARDELVAPVDLSVGSGRRWWAVLREGRDRSVSGVLEWCLAELHAIETRHAAIV